MQSLWMILASLAFALSGLTVKFASQYANPAQALTFRGLVALCAVGLWCVIYKHNLKTPHPKLHLSRSTSGVFSLALFTYTLMALPLATAVTLNYTAPVWLACMLIVLAFWKGKAQPNRALVACILLSLVGVTLLLKPVFSSGQLLDALLGLLSGFLSAVAYWQIRKLGSLNEPVWRIVFYHSLTATLAGLIWWLYRFNPIDMRALPWLLANGAFALIGQLAMTRAYSAGKALFTSNLQYLTVVFAAVFGALFTHDVLDVTAYIGIVLIIACSVFATVLSVKKA